LHVEHKVRVSAVVINFRTSTAFILSRYALSMMADIRPENKKMAKLAKLKKQFLRFASARTDIYYARQAYQLIQQCPFEEITLHLFTSMVVSYCRPFTENTGIGNLTVEFPEYPDYEDPMMNLRHSRMMDVRNKFLSHSSVEGTGLLLIPPGITNPLNQLKRKDWDYNIGKRQFVQPSQRAFIDWIAPICDALGKRLDRKVHELLPLIGEQHQITDRAFEIDTGANSFQWTIPEPGSPSSIRPGVVKTKKPLVGKIFYPARSSFLDSAF